MSLAPAVEVNSRKKMQEQDDRKLISFFTNTPVLFVKGVEIKKSLEFAP